MSRSGASRKYNTRLVARVALEDDINISTDQSSADVFNRSSKTARSPPRVKELPEELKLNIVATKSEPNNPTETSTGYSNFQPGPRSTDFLGVENPLPVVGDDDTAHSVASRSPVESDDESLIAVDLGNTRVLEPIVITTPTRNNAIEENNFEITMADITLRDALNDRPQPAVPKFVAPSSFDPARNNVAAFIKQYEDVSRQNGWDEKHKINYLGAFLTGAAYGWYSNFIQNAQNQGCNWVQIKKALVSEFGGECPTREIKLMLNNRKQGISEDIKQYFFDLVALCDQIENVSEERFVEYFEAGLHPVYFEKYKLLCGPQMSKAAIKSIVLKLSEIYQTSLYHQINAAFANVSFLGEQTAANTNHNEGLIAQKYVQSSNYKRLADNDQNVQDSRELSYGRSRTRDARPICWNCGRPGHFARSCNVRRNVGQGRDKPSYVNTREYSTSNTRNTFLNGQHLRSNRPNDYGRQD